MVPPKVDKNIKEMVIARFNALPENISFSIGSYGDFTRNQLIEEIKKNSEIGKVAVEMQIRFIKNMAKVSARLSKGVVA